MSEAEITELVNDPWFILFAPGILVIAVVLVYLWMKHGD